MLDLGIRVEQEKMYSSLRSDGHKIKSAVKQTWQLINHIHQKRARKCFYFSQYWRIIFFATCVANEIFSVFENINTPLSWNNEIRLFRSSLRSIPKYWTSGPVCVFYIKKSFSLPIDEATTQKQLDWCLKFLFTLWLWWGLLMFLFHSLMAKFMVWLSFCS